MNENVIFGVGGMIFVLVLLVPLTVVLAWQGLRLWQMKITSRAEIARDEAYRKLAEEVVAAQQKLAGDQQKMARDLSDMRDRIAAMEKMLREVD